MKNFFLVSILTLLFLFIASTVNAQWVTTQLTNNSYDEWDSQINASGHVVWRGGVHPNVEIFYYDGTTVTQLTNNSYAEWAPQINASGQVVWAGHDGTDYEIFIAEFIEDVDGDGVGYYFDNCFDIPNPDLSAGSITCKCHPQQVTAYLVCQNMELQEEVAYLIEKHDLLINKIATGGC